MLIKNVFLVLIEKITFTNLMDVTLSILQFYVDINNIQRIRSVIILIKTAII